MTTKELYEWAKERDLLDVQLAKNFNFSIEDIEEVAYLTEEFTKSEPRVVLS